MLDSARHRKILIEILRDIFRNPFLATRLAFKGGTAAMFLYDLPRFSVDLDFDLIHTDEDEEVFGQLQKLLGAYGTVRKARNMPGRMMFIFAYDGKSEREYNVKVDVNKINFGSAYELKKIVGMPVRVMKQSDMVAHKLVALYERLSKANRDIFDVWFFLKNHWPVNKEIIEKRTKMSFNDFLDTMIEALADLDDTHILSGLGELLSTQQRHWVRSKLKDEALFQLRLLREIN